MYSYVVLISLSPFQIGLVSSLPYVGRFFCGQLGGALGDGLIARPHLISKRNTRRLMFSIAYLSPALGLAVMGYLTQRWELCIAVMTVCK